MKGGGGGGICREEWDGVTGEFLRGGVRGAVEGGCARWLCSGRQRCSKAQHFAWLQMGAPAALDTPQRTKHARQRRAKLTVPALNFVEICGGGRDGCVPKVPVKRCEWALEAGARVGHAGDLPAAK